MNTEPRRAPVHIPIHVRRIESGLQPRTIALARSGESASRVLVLLSDGTGSLQSTNSSGRARDKALIGPGLFWLAQPSGLRLSIEAGTTGHVAEIADETIARAVGDFAESATLMFMVGRDLDLSFDPADPALRQFDGHLGAVHEELSRPQIGGAMQIVAYLRIILVMMMRVSGLEEIAGVGGEAHFLQRFRQLVEGHYREHWPVGRYASELGITHDRLHAICRRELSKTPKALIAERLAREAGLALERSSLSVEQVSDTLGFRDPAHFSNFFKKMTGLAPGRFRKLAASGAGDFSPPSFSDWP